MNKKKLSLIFILLLILGTIYYIFSSNSPLIFVQEQLNQEQLNQEQLNIHKTIKKVENFAPPLDDSTYRFYSITPRPSFTAPQSYLPPQDGILCYLNYYTNIGTMATATIRWGYSGGLGEVFLWTPYGRYTMATYSYGGASYLWTRTNLQLRVLTPYYGDRTNLSSQTTEYFAVFDAVCDVYLEGVQVFEDLYNIDQIPNDRYNQGYSAGVNQVILNPNSYGLFDESDMESRYERGYENGRYDGVVIGNEQVQNDPASFGLYSYEQYQEAYNSGFTLGSQSNINVNWIYSIFNIANNFLNIEILPNIKIIYFIGIILVLNFVKLILSFVR